MEVTEKTEPKSTIELSKNIKIEPVSMEGYDPHLEIIKLLQKIEINTRK